METETTTTSGNIAMSKKTLHPDTLWVKDLINKHSDRRTKTKLMTALGKRIGRSKGTLYTYLKEPNGVCEFNAEQLIKIAEYFSVDPPESAKRGAALLDGPKMLEAPNAGGDNVIELRPAPPGVDSAVFPVEGVTFVGFRALDKVTHPKKSHVAGPRSLKYPRARHVTWEVGKDDESMNQKTIFPGAYIMCVDFKDVGKLENDDIVVVERTRFGLMIERSIRMVVVSPEGIRFEPRTSDTDPAIDSFSMQGDENTSVKVLGVYFAMCAGDF